MVCGWHDAAQRERALWPYLRMIPVVSRFVAIAVGFIVR
jgi:hypothetical protein